MAVGRFLCVSIPFGLSVASLIFIMIAALAGVTDKSLDLFQVDTAHLSISTSDIINLENALRKRDGVSTNLGSRTLTASSVSSAVGSEKSAAASAVASALGTNNAVNITGTALGLADSYKVSLWGYCATTGKDTTCTKAKFNWAASALNTTDLNSLTKEASALGVNATLPKDVQDSLKTFATVSKWTQVVYIIAIIGVVIELIFGIFAICSRVGACLTSLIAGFATGFVIAASIMATVLSSITVGAIKSASKAYGVQASLNTHFLAMTWVAVVFSLAAGFFWTFTTCCCAPDHRNKNRMSRNSDQEKLMPQSSGYQRVQDPMHVADGYHGQQHGIYNPQRNQPQATRTGAYEPYAHAAI